MEAPPDRGYVNVFRDLSQAEVAAVLERTQYSLVRGPAAKRPVDIDADLEFDSSKGELPPPLVPLGHTQPSPPPPQLIIGTALQLSFKISGIKLGIFFFGFKFRIYEKLRFEVEVFQNRSHRVKPVKSSFE